MASINSSSLTPFHRVREMKSQLLSAIQCHQGGDGDETRISRLNAPLLARSCAACRVLAANVSANQTGCFVSLNPKTTLEKGAQ